MVEFVLFYEIVRVHVHVNYVKLNVYMYVYMYFLFLSLFHFCSDMIRATYSFSYRRRCLVDQARFISFFFFLVKIVKKLFFFIFPFQGKGKGKLKTTKNESTLKSFESLVQYCEDTE